MTARFYQVVVLANKHYISPSIQQHGVHPDRLLMMGDSLDGEPGRDVAQVTVSTYQIDPIDVTYDLWLSVYRMRRPTDIPSTIRARARRPTIRCR